MITVSNDFKTAMKQPVKEIQAHLDYGDNVIRDSDDLISFKISCDSGLCKTAMRKLEAKYLGNHNLLGKWVHALFGVKLPDGSFEFLDYGSFLVTELTVTKDTETTNIVAYDKMVNAMIPYVKLSIEYPVSLIDYTRVLCDSCGLKLGNESFAIMNDWQITQELWENIEGITYRDIFVQIAQATGTTCIIGADDKVHFKETTFVDESLTYDNMFKLKLEAEYGPINSVVLARTPSEDNIYSKDEVSVNTYGLTEFKIENNEIIDKDRESAVGEILSLLEGYSYYPFETTTEGLGWYEIADHIKIVNDAGEEFYTTIFNYSITIDGSIKETLKATAESKTQTQYQYATSIAKRVKNTEVIVNKQEQYIKQLVSDMYEENGVVNEKYSQIYQDIDNIINSVQNSGGSNLIKNSVMFAYDTNGNPTSWEIEGDGTIIISSSAEALKNGGISGHEFTLLDKIARQSVQVKVSTESQKTSYTFSTKIKKNAAGSCYVKIYNAFEEYYITLPSGTSAFYGDFEIKGISPKENYYVIEFYGTADSNATFTDNMFAMGEFKSQWTQANGEVMNTQVNVNLDGIVVRSSVYLGDYTVVSPLEFAGYSNINGTPTKVFSLNKDVTEIKKLLAKDEIKMTPLKVIPVTTGDMIGWAFIPTTEV